eukprot:scaffold301_cov243-Pinguiococcus_pyrenoidosus.AAC.5
MEHIHARRSALLALHHGEDMGGVEHPRVYGAGVQVIEAKQEDLGGRLARRAWLDGFHILEELLQHPQQLVVVPRPIHLGAESAPAHQVLRRGLQRRQHQLILHVGILHIGGSHIWRSVAKHHVRLPPVQLLAKHVSALPARDVRHQRLHLRDGADGQQVHAHDDALGGHGLRCHLQPAARGRAQVHEDLRLGQKLMLAVDLEQLEGRTGAEAPLLGQAIVLVAVLVLGALHHGAPIQFRGSLEASGRRGRHAEADRTKPTRKGATRKAAASLKKSEQRGSQYRS